MGTSEWTLERVNHLVGSVARLQLLIQRADVMLAFADSRGIGRFNVAEDLLFQLDEALPDIVIALLLLVGFKRWHSETGDDERMRKTFDWKDRCKAVMRQCVAREHFFDALVGLRGDVLDNLRVYLDERRAELLSMTLENRYVFLARDRIDMTGPQHPKAIVEDHPFFDVAPAHHPLGQQHDASVKTMRHKVDNARWRNLSGNHY